MSYLREKLENFMAANPCAIYNALRELLPLIVERLEPSEETPTTEARRRGEEEAANLVKEFDNMMVTIHDLRRHELRNISLCHDPECKERVRLRNLLEQLFTE